MLVWLQRLWRCVEPRCSQRTWSKTHPQIRSRALLTVRAQVWAMQRVGQHSKTVVSVARQLGVGWHTAMRAVRKCGEPLVEDPVRRDGVRGLGVDEHIWQHAGSWRRTGITDLTPGRPPRLLDVVPGWTGKVYANWIRGQDQQWRADSASPRLTRFGGTRLRWPTRSGC